ncbi:MAG: hypothetical protein ABL963_00880 [Longimicrobiales bacterium]
MPTRPWSARLGSHAWRSAFAAIGTLGVLAGCEVPNFEGPQIQEPPQGFLLAPDSYQQRRLFPELEITFHAAWVESIDDFSTIYIDGHPGALGFEDVVNAREQVRLLAMDPDIRFGEVEPLLVDGRDAWGWSERVESPTRGLESVAFRAVVPYDTISYAIEFYTGDPSIKRVAPDTLKAIISTFAVGRTTYNWPLIAVLAGLVLFGVSVLQSKRRERATRMKSINLVKVPKKKPDAQGGPDAAPAGAPPAAPSPATGAASPPPQPSPPAPTPRGGPAPYKKA